MNRSFREVGTAPQQGGRKSSDSVPYRLFTSVCPRQILQPQGKWDLVCMLQQIQSREDFHPAHTESFWPAGPDSWVPGAFTPYQVALMALSPGLSD